MWGVKTKTYINEKLCQLSSGYKLNRIPKQHILCSKEQPAQTRDDDDQDTQMSDACQDTQSTSFFNLVALFKKGGKHNT